MFLREYLQINHGIARRKFTDFVDQEQILINNKVVESYKYSLQEGDELRVKSIDIKEKIRLKEQKSESKIILFNKPKGYVVSKSDAFNATIYGLLPKKFENYYYIGRLDKESRGLLLLTDDPKLVHQREHPKFAIEKEYVVQIDKPLYLEDIQKMKKGVEDEGDLLNVKSVEGRGTRVKIVLVEGKKRQIRRILRVLGYRVLDLQRIREGNHILGDLKEGQWKLI